LPVRHAEGVRRLGLAVTDRLDARAEDLGHVRAVVQAEAQDAGLERREGQDVHERQAAEVPADLRQRQIDQEQLDDQRRAAEERRVEAAEAVRDRVFRDPAERPEQRQDDREHDRADGKQQRPLDAAEDEPEVVLDERRVQIEQEEDDDDHREDRRPDDPDLQPERDLGAAERHRVRSAHRSAPEHQADDLERGERGRDVALGAVLEPAEGHQPDRDRDRHRDREPPGPAVLGVQEPAGRETEHAARDERQDPADGDVRRGREDDDRREDEADPALGQEQPRRDQLEPGALRDLGRIGGKPGRPGLPRRLADGLIPHRIRRRS
jgi:hypothetical protein